MIDFCHARRLTSALAILASIQVVACSDDPGDVQPAADGSSASAGAAGHDTTNVGGSAGATSAGGNGGTAGAGGSSSNGSDSGSVSDGGIACADAGAVTPPVVADALKPPAGATLLARFHAVGTQIYTCTAMGDAGDAGATAYAWVLKAPDAKLYDAACMLAGTHFAGPTWKNIDGSSVVGARVASTTAAGSIPWLLLKAISNAGEGSFANVTAVQRVDTVGGAAPATGCDAGRIGSDDPIGYSANYYFYVGGVWPTDDAAITDAAEGG